MLVQKIIHIEFHHKIVRLVVRIRSVTALLAAVGRHRQIAVPVPVVAVFRRVAEPETAVTVAGVEIEIKAVGNKIVALERNGRNARRAVVVSLADIGVNSLNFSLCGGADEFDFGLVEIPFCGFERRSEHHLSKLVVVARNLAIVKVLQAHCVVVVRIGEHAANTELKAHFVARPLEGRADFVRVERSNLVTRIEIDGRIFLCHHVHRAAQRRPAEAVGYNALVNLNALNHIGRDIVKRHIIRQLPDSRLININTHTLAFEPAHRYSRRAAHTACVADGYARCPRQSVVNVRRGAFQLFHRYHRQRHCSLAHLTYLVVRHNIDRLYLAS